jgi:hypothetical protein
MSLYCVLFIEHSSVSTLLNAIVYALANSLHKTYTDTLLCVYMLGILDKLSTQIYGIEIREEQEISWGPNCNEVYICLQKKKNLSTRSSTEAQYKINTCI